MNRAVMMIVAGGALAVGGLALGNNERTDAREKSEVGKWTCAILDNPSSECEVKPDYVLPAVVGGFGALVLLAGLVSFGTMPNNSRRDVSSEVPPPPVS